MRLSILIVTAGMACLLAGVGAGLAEEVKPHDGLQPYVGVYGGVAIPATFDNVKYGAASLGDLKMKSGSIFGTKVGFYGHNKDKVWRWFGLEGDVSYTSTAVKAQSLRIPGFSPPVAISQTDVNVLTGALHILVKYPDGPVQPYVGVGPAVVHARVESSTVFSSGSTTAIGLSAVGGIRFKFNDQVGAFLEYKQIRASLEFDDIQGDAIIHAGVVGVNLMF